MISVVPLMNDKIGNENLKSFTSVIECFIEGFAIPFLTNFMSYPTSVFQRAARVLSSSIAKSMISSKHVPDSSE